MADDGGTAHGSGAVVTFVGTGDAFGSGGRLNTCILVEHRRGAFLLDCGASTPPALRRLERDPASLDAVLVTHLHGDHFGGIPFLIRETQISARRTRPLTLGLPGGGAKRLDHALEALFPGSSGEITFPMRIVEWEPGMDAARIGPLRVRAFPMTHTPGTNPFALRVEGPGFAIGYSGDTGWSDALLEAARGTDLFVCEAYTFDRVLSTHLDYATVLRRAPELACRRLILTHPGPELLARADELEIELARDGMVLPLGRHTTTEDPSAGWPTPA